LFSLYNYKKRHRPNQKAPQGAFLIETTKLEFLDSLELQAQQLVPPELEELLALGNHMLQHHHHK